jgi:hypothetical protein
MAALPIDCLNWRLFGVTIGLSVLLSVGTLLFLPHLLGPEVDRALSIRSITAPLALEIAGRTAVSAPYPPAKPVGHSKCDDGAHGSSVKP